MVVAMLAFTIAEVSHKESQNLIPNPNANPNLNPIDSLTLYNPSLIHLNIKIQQFAYQCNRDF